MEITGEEDCMERGRRAWKAHRTKLYGTKFLITTAVGVVFAFAAAHVAATVQGFKIVASKLSHDENTNLITVSDGKITFGESQQLTAEILRFQLPERGAIPYVVLLTRGGELTAGRQRYQISEGARYYPELSVIVAKTIRNRTSDVDYACKNGTLYKNGKPAPKDSGCLAGGLKITCNGDDMEVTAGDQACPAGEY
jgi:hypothetical protein